jgi:hypothetical protein
LILGKYDHILGKIEVIASTETETRSHLGKERRYRLLGQCDCFYIGFEAREFQERAKELKLKLFGKKLG